MKIAPTWREHKALEARVEKLEARADAARKLFKRILIVLAEAGMWEFDNVPTDDTTDERATAAAGTDDPDSR